MRERRMLWFVGVFLVSLFCFLVYATAQQVLRLSANDPQTQIGKDIVTYLNAGNDPMALAYETKVDIANSYSPFIMIFDKTGKLLASSGVLNGKNPELPKGVLDVASKKGENRLTWQPAPSVREAAVVTKYKNGYVLVARSLIETEARVRLVLIYSAMAWFLGVIVITGTYFIARKAKK